VDLELEAVVVGEASSESPTKEQIAVAVEVNESQGRECRDVWQDQNAPKGQHART